jgi:hypothetical protein
MRKEGDFFLQITKKPPMIEDIFNIEKIKQKFSLNKSRSKMLVSLFRTRLINREDKLILILDRTYWMRGIVHLNFLYLSIFYKGYGIPLFFKILLDKKVHSGVTALYQIIAILTAFAHKGGIVLDAIKPIKLGRMDGSLSHLLGYFWIF